MAKISYGCQTYPWKMNQSRFEGDVPHIARVTAEAGFEGLESEICMLGHYFDDPAKTKEILEANNLRLAALVLHQDWNNMTETEEEKKLSDKAIAFLADFPKAKLMVSHHAVPGDRKEDPAELKKRREQVISCMASVADRAGEQGIVTAYHPNSSVNSLFRTYDDYEVLFDMLSRTYVGWIPDIGHIVNGGMDALEMIKMGRSLIRHVHFKDRIAQNEWAVMGEGNIDYPAIVNYLKETQYGGWIMVEDESPKASADSDSVVMADGIYMKQFRD